MNNSDLANAGLINIDNACFGYSTLPVTALPINIISHSNFKGSNERVIEGCFPEEIKNGRYLSHQQLIDRLQPQTDGSHMLPFGNCVAIISPNKDFGRDTYNVILYNAYIGAKWEYVAGIKGHIKGIDNAVLAANNLNNSNIFSNHAG